MEYSDARKFFRVSLFDAQRSLVCTPVPNAHTQGTATRASHTDWIVLLQAIAVRVADELNVSPLMREPIEEGRVHAVIAF
jgi:hypothetical protein